VKANEYTLSGKRRLGASFFGLLAAVTFGISGLVLATTTPSWAGVQETPQSDPDGDTDVEDPADIAPPSGIVNLRIAFKKPLDISESEQGQKIEARLQDELKMGNKVLAPSGSLIIGHLELAKRGSHRSSTMAKISGRGPIPVFDRIVTSNHEELRIIGIPQEQNSVFSNGETIRQILVGEHGELLRVDDGDFAELEDFGFGVPHAWMPGNPSRIKIEEGDQLTITATMPAGVSVSATVIKHPQKN
jgi:hypothetical protein